MSIAITILIFLVVSFIIYGMYEKSFNKCLNLGPNEFVERKFLLKASSLDLSKILLGLIFFTIIIVDLVEHFFNNPILAFSAGAIFFYFVCHIYNEDIYLLYRKWNSYNTTKGYSD